MSTAYTKEVSDNLGNVRIVYDKFHFMWLKTRANCAEK